MAKEIRKLEEENRELKEERREHLKEIEDLERKLAGARSTAKQVPNLMSRTQHLEMLLTYRDRTIKQLEAALKPKED